MGIRKDISGQVFGRLTVLSDTGSYVGKKCPNVLVQCECGNTKMVNKSSLKGGHITSCGCYYSETRMGKLTHGEVLNGKQSPEYITWNSMKQRCCNENSQPYKYYGGRGIKICDRWLASFNNFLKDMGRRPSSKHSLDRYPNKNGNYETGNCRWATDTEQMNNTRYNRCITFNGQTMSLSEWATKLNIGSNTFRYRVEKFGGQEAIKLFMNNEVRIIKRPERCKN